jgi:hypothetical protein|tara:strand:- start:77 stop:328 length:252 start_codon:yes stop_codon:yes gene_type:complete
MLLITISIMNQNEKPYQYLAWLATGMLILAAFLASFVPSLEYHHWAFIIANSIWVIVGILWKETTLIVLNAGLTLIYILGLIL